MSRRRFDHLVAEFAVAVRTPVPRYALWLTLHDDGLDPEQLTRGEALAFCKKRLRHFAAERGLRLGLRAHRRLMREVKFYDPEVDSPAERLDFEDEGF